MLCSWGDDITPPQQALNWILDIYASDDDLLAQGQTIVYSVHPKVGHLGIFVSGAVARKEHAGFVELLDLIEALPPGLYEMLIEDKRPDMRGAQLVPDRYVTRFERRSVEPSPPSAATGRGERPFEVVRRISEMNAGLYEQLVAPAVRSLANESTAERRASSTRCAPNAGRLSDLNPMVLPFARRPGVVRGTATLRRGQPIRAIEREVAGAVERVHGDARCPHKASERVFGSLRDSAGARGGGSRRHRHRCRSAPTRCGANWRDARREELCRRRQGNGADGIVRILLLLMNETGAIDERTYRALHAVRDELPPRHRA